MFTNNNNNVSQLPPVIDSNILILWGATFRKYSKNEIIFYENDVPSHYHQIENGCVRTFNDSINGKEFTQGLFNVGQSFGEPALLLNKPYPVSAQAIKDSVIIKLPLEKFNNMLSEQAGVSRKLLLLMCDIVYSKTFTSKSLALDNAEEKILIFFNKIKMNEKQDYIPYTRQEIANFLGLRIETVIRAISKLKKEGKLEILKNKIYI